MHSQNLDEIYFSEDFTAISVGQGDRLILNQSTGAKAIMGSQESEILRLCQQPRSISGHLAQMEKEWGYRPDWKELEPIWSGLERQGHLCTLTKFKEQLTVTENKGKGTPIRAVTMSIRSVSPLLKRGLESAVPHIQKIDRKMELVLASEQEDSDEAISIVKELDCDIELRWIGLKERQEFAQWLARDTGLSPQLCIYALAPDFIGNKTGALRNALLLDQVNHAAINADDDVVWDIRKMSYDPNKITLGTTKNPLWNYAPINTCAKSWGEPEARSLFELHENFLGKTASPILKSYSDIEPLGLNSILLKSLRSRSAKITTTSLGYRGGSTLQAASAFFSLPSGSPPEWLTDDDAYAKFAQSEELTFSVKNTCCGYAASPFLGIAMDASHQLPPFSPLHRAQDVLFQVFLQSDPLNLTVLMPETLYHQPPKRVLSHKLHEELTKPLPMYIWILKLYQHYKKTCVLSSYQEFGKWVREIITKEPEEMVRLLNVCHQKHIWDFRQRLSLHLVEHRLAKEFQLDRDFSRKLLDQRLLDPQSYTPWEVHHADDPIREFLAQLSLFGELLENWSLLFASAQKYQQQGNRVSRLLI